MGPRRETRTADTVGYPCCVWSVRSTRTVGTTPPGPTHWQHHFLRRRCYTVRGIGWAGLGWAVCDGRSSEEQGIPHAVIQKTPDLSGRFLQGATANDFKQLKPAHFPVLQFNNFAKGGPGSYDHGEFSVATDGTSMIKNGLHMFAGKWDTPASVIDVKWKTTNGAIDVAPASYTVVYIMLVK
jgi:hypothetical protein